MLEKTTEINLLYDYYSPLLTEKQRTLLELYYQEDWSLGEIAKHQGVSRQAVFEALKRAQTQLYQLEEKLGLLHKETKRKQVLQEIESCLERFPSARQALEPLLDQWKKIDA